MRKFLATVEKQFYTPQARFLGLELEAPFDARFRRVGRRNVCDLGRCFVTGET